MSIINHTPDKVEPVPTDIVTEPTPVTVDTTLIDEENRELQDKNTMIELKGSLSKNFTDALNAILEKKVVSLLGSTDSDIIMYEEQDYRAEPTKTLIYAESDGDISQSELLHAAESIRAAKLSNQYKEVILAFEDNITYSRRLSLLERVAIDLHIPVTRSIASLINRIQ